MSSSGLVADCPSNRDLNEYGPSKVPLSTFSRPLPSARFPFHSASAFRVGIKPPFVRLLVYKKQDLLFPGQRFPPGTTSVWPVTQPESAEARNTATEAMSDGCPIRPSGVCAS